jgi:hypothetical protein
MELRPVEGIRAVGPVDVRRAASDVTPALGVEAEGRMEDDSYGGSAKRQGRGLEEEDTVLEDELGSPDLVTGPGKVDVVA